MNTLAFRGAVIRDRNEFLSLTDMWRAAGSPDSKKPVVWMRTKSVRQFVDHLALVKGDDYHLFDVSRGCAGETWAHWQIGIAYAKHLNHDFHMWANDVVRGHMEGVKTRVEEEAEAKIAPLIAMVHGLIEKVSELSKLADPRLAVVEYISMREVLNKAGAFPKGRRSLQGRLSRCFHNRAREKGVAFRRDPHSSQHQWLFPIEFAEGCMRDFGNAMVAAHNEVSGRQGVLPFKKPVAVQTQDEARV